VKSTLTSSGSNFLEEISTFSEDDVRPPLENLIKEVQGERTDEESWEKYKRIGRESEEFLMDSQRQA